MEHKDQHICHSIYTKLYLSYTQEALYLNIHSTDNATAFGAQSCSAFADSAHFLRLTYSPLVLEFVIAVVITIIATEEQKI